MSVDSPLVTLDYPTSLHQGGANGQVTRVVMHATVSPCQRGGAAANARYFQSPAAGGAAHYIVDPYDVAQSVREAVVAWHAPPNAGSVGVELCDPQTGPDERWQNGAHEAMLTLAAALVADICGRHSLPIQWLSSSQLLAGDTGITSHANIAQAWHATDHTDPGPAFPVDHFLALVAGAITPAPHPTFAEDDMAIIYQRGDDPDAQSFLLHGGKLCFQDAHEVLELASKGVPVVDHCTDKTWKNLVKQYGDPGTV